MISRRILSFVGKAARCFVVVLALAAGYGCPRGDRQPPANVSNFSATAGDGQVALSWTNPSDDDFKAVLILRRQGGYPANPTDGTVVYDAPGESTVDTNLINGTLYYYTAFAYDAVPNHASGAQAQAMPTSSSAQAQILEQFNLAEEELEDANIPPSAGQTLAETLDEAETAYRDGDPCAAATLLERYEAEAQTFRQASADPEEGGEFEALFVLGRRLRHDLLAAAPNKVDCSGQERVGVEATDSVDEDHNDNTELQATATFGEPRLLTVRHEGEVFTKVEIPGTDSLTGTEPGAPAVPIFRRLIAVPEGAQVTAECDPETAETIFVNLLPMPLPAVDAPPPVPGGPPDPSAFRDKPFVRNVDIYDSNEAYPPAPCKLTDLGELRDVRTYLLEVAAGQYNPATDALTLYSHVNIHTTFTGGGAFATERINSSFESNSILYTSSFLNASAVSRFLDDIDIIAIIGEEFMILTPPQFRPAADSLADWKNEKGIVTRVFEVGVGTTTDTREEIVDLIKDEYENAHIRPSYVLILGNTSFIPCHYLTPNGDVGSDTIGTDYPYAAFGLFGILPKVALGRIPVSNLADANLVVNKIIDYERNPPIDADFYRRAAIAAQFQCCYWEAYSIGTLGTDQRTFILSAEFARNAMRAAGKTVDRIYRETVDPLYEFDTTPRRYPDGSALPADLGPGSGFDWASDTADITAAWNAGRFLIIHRDHGWPGGWVDPEFAWSDADALTNGDLLPVVFSVNCASGLFDQETAGGALSTMPGIPYFAERLLINPNGGAVGVLGDTRNSPTWANSALTRGYVDAVWPNAIADFGANTSHRRLGDILNHGKVYLFTQGGLAGANIPFTDVADELKMWHCIGDPTLELWTTNPNRGILSTVADLQFDLGTVVAGYETEGAQLTLFRPNVEGNEPLGRGTVANGLAVFELLGELPQEGENLLLAATLPNAVPELIQVQAPVLDRTPPANVGAFQANLPGNNFIQVILTWRNPPDPDFAGVRIQRKTGGFPTSPTDGTTVYNDAGTQFTDNGVTNNQTFYYTAYAYDTSGNFASGVQDVVTIIILTR